MTNTSSQFQTFLNIFNTNTVSAPEATATDAFTASSVIIRPMNFAEPLVSGVNRVLQKSYERETHTHTHAKLTGLDEPLPREDVQLPSILSLQSSVH